MTGERQPKIAAATVKEIFSTSKAHLSLPAAAVGLLVLIAFVTWGWARWQSKFSRVIAAEQNERSQPEAAVLSDDGRF